MEAIETKEVGDLTIRIFPDSDPMNPRREWDNLGTMICFHGRYDLGEKHKLSLEEAQEIAADDRNVVLPLFLYDHGGITMSTGAFSCPWDSGQVGFIYVTPEKMIEEYGNDSEETRARVREYLESEVKVYDQYLTGDIYGFVIEDKEGEELESCWGFFGTEDCLAEAESVAKYLTESLLAGGSYVI